MTLFLVWVMFYCTAASIAFLTGGVWGVLGFWLGIAFQRFLNPSEGPHAGDH